jgi:sterol desaturase/sphingolipid hydroxylase (fatty acid hydroxylase superfamily)
MRLSTTKIAYFADFAVYGCVLAGLSITAICRGGWADHLRWLGSMLIGGAVWTLLEYLLHRFVLHGLRPFSALHAQHHDAPRAYLGTPTWISLAVLGGVFFLPAWWGFSFAVAAGFTCGLVIGYVWYGLVHHVVHHRHPAVLAARLGAAMLRHHHHHNPTQLGNFGVTTSLWDNICRTRLPEQQCPAAWGGRSRRAVRSRSRPRRAASTLG